MRTSRFVQLAALALAALVVGCEAPPPTPLQLPDGLLIDALPAEQRALVRVTLELSGSALPETDLVLADDLTLSGTFALQNASDGRRAATLRVYGRFAEDSEEVLLGRAVDTVDIALGQTTTATAPPTCSTSRRRRRRVVAASTPRRRRASSRRAPRRCSSRRASASGSSRGR
jgi:hypothetical protein